MTCRLDIIHIHLFELLDIVENPLELPDEGFQFLVAEVEFCQIRYFKNFRTGNGQVHTS